MNDDVRSSNKSQKELPSEASPRGGASLLGEKSPSERRLAYWFGFLLLWLFALVIVGGSVRLTHSGMSIPDWPIIYYGENKTEGSILPPFSQAAWETVHATYHDEYLAKVGRTVSMERFKTEFYIEYGHRALAKLFGVLYLITLVWIFKNPLLRKKLGTLFIVSGLVLVFQAVVGGIVVRTHTPALTVAFHLTTAYIFVSIVVWMLLKLLRPDDLPKPARPPQLAFLAQVVLLMGFIQVFLGGIMAKTEAARIQWLATWPKMGETWIPPQAALWANDLGLRNLVENEVTVQFVHRWFAWIVALGVIALAVKCLRAPLTPSGRIAMRASVFILALQILIGILTLVHMVPTPLGLLHLGTGLVFILLLVCMVFEIRHNPAIAEAEEREAVRLEKPIEATA